MKKTLALGLIFSSIFSGNVFAASAPGVTMGTPSFSGSACSTSGSVSATLSPDNSTLTVLFNSFVAQAGGTTGKVKDRADCKVAIPLTVTPGQRLVLVRADYRGYHHVPSGARNAFRQAYALADSTGYRRGPTVSKYFYGPLDENYTLESDSQGTVISGCGNGTPMTLYIAASVGVTADRSLASTLATLDSVDATTDANAQTGMTYYLVYQAC